jgi:hypothetical protein
VEPDPVLNQSLSPPSLGLLLFARRCSAGIIIVVITITIITTSRHPYPRDICAFRNHSGGPQCKHSSFPPGHQQQDAGAQATQDCHCGQQSRRYVLRGTCRAITRSKSGGSRVIHKPQTLERKQERNSDICTLHVGKSSLTVQFVDGHFVESYYPTIENTFSKVIRYKNQDFATEIIDTAGQVLR